MKKLLVVDDEPAVRRMLVAVLEDEGYAVIPVHTGERALDVLATEHIDLVVLDIMLPGIDGYTVLHRMKALPRGEGIPVLLMSAAVRPMASESNAAAFLAKPFDLDQLLAAVRNALAKQQSAANEASA